MISIVEEEQNGNGLCSVLSRQRDSHIQRGPIDQIPFGPLDENDKK